MKSLRIIIPVSLIIGSILVIGVCFLLTQDSSEEENHDSEPAQETGSPVDEPVLNDENDENAVSNEVDYDVVEEKDISIGGCSRTTTRVLLPDESSEDEIEATLQSIIDSRKDNIDDITVWAYKESERDTKLGMYTMGMKEYSICN